MQETPAKPVEDEDLYCLSCGYNLRGLSGDPRRCPECGYLNPMSELTIPAAMIKKQLRKLETAPTVSVGCALAALVGVVAFLGG